MRRNKIPITEIARQLNRSRQTIYNELRRGSYLHTVDYQDVVRYSADKGQAIRELASKCKGRRIKTENDADYMDFLEYMILKGKYSPAAALAEARAVGYTTTICVTTLYSYISKRRFPRLRDMDLLEKVSRRHRKKSEEPRIVHKDYPSIEVRPEHIGQRSEGGHWEMDLIVGCRGSKAVLLTLTEKVGGQTVTLKVYEPDEEGIARYALFNADGTEIDIPFGLDRGTWIWNGNAAEKVSLTARDDVLGFPGFELETIQGIVMTVCDFYALTEQGFVYAGEAFGHGFDDTEWGDGVWPLDLTGDGRSELVTRSTFGTGVPRVFVYRWNAAEGISQHSGIVWEKADAQLAKLSAPLGSVARAETYHAEDNTVTLTLYTENGTKETTLPLTTDILGEWFAED